MLPTARQAREMSPKTVTTNVTNDRGSRTFLGVETVHKIMIEERGDRGIEFGRRNHSQIDGSREDVALEEYT